MISKRSLLAGLAGACLSFIASQAIAHRLPVAVTTIEPLENGRLGITHRLHAHEAVQILAKDPEVRQPELEGTKARAKVAWYVSKHFQISHSDDEKQLAPVKVDIIGAELDGDYFFIYQETDFPKTGQSLYLKSTILQDLDGAWLSHVNYSFDKSVRTVAYSDKPDWQELKWQ